MENSITSRECHVLNPDEQCALKRVEKSLKYVNGRYQVAIPWKEEDPKLPDNYGMALRRLCNTEKRLLKSPEIADSLLKEYYSIFGQGLHSQDRPS